MVNKKGGKKHKKMKKSSNIFYKSYLDKKSKGYEETEYAVVTKKRGTSMDLRMIITDESSENYKRYGGKTVIGLLVGSIRKQGSRIKLGTVVLVDMRDFETYKPTKKKKVNIIYYYDDSNLRTLIRNKEILEEFLDDQSLSVLPHENKTNDIVFKRDYQKKVNYQPDDIYNSDDDSDDDDMDLV